MNKEYVSTICSRGEEIIFNLMFFKISAWIVWFGSDSFSPLERIRGWDSQLTSCCKIYMKWHSVLQRLPKLVTGELSYTPAYGWMVIHVVPPEQGSWTVGKGRKLPFWSVWRVGWSLNINSTDFNQWQLWCWTPKAFNGLSARNV